MRLGVLFPFDGTAHAGALGLGNGLTLQNGAQRQPLPSVAGSEKGMMGLPMDRARDSRSAMNVYVRGGLITITRRAGLGNRFP